VQSTDAYLRLARLQVAAGHVDQALVPLEFEPGGRPGEDEASLLELELLARSRRPPPPPVLARLEGNRRATAAAAIARGMAAGSGPAVAIEFLKHQDDLDLRDPKNADALAELITVLVAAGKGREAVTRADAAVKAHADVAVLHALRGTALAASGASAKEARSAYQRALELDPGEHRALAGLAALEAGEGGNEAALALYERAVRADAGDAASARAAARLQATLGRGEDAESRLAALLRETPYDGETALALAELRVARGAEPGPTRELARRAAKFGGGPAAQALLDRIGAEKAEASAPADEG
jgi:tetratricopeptide (TPR) repeat protein